MGDCYSSDNVTGDHIYKAITSRNIEESQQKYRLGTVNK